MNDPRTLLSILAVVAVLAGLAGCGPSSGPAPADATKPAAAVALEPHVTFDGTHFLFQNWNRFDWTDVVIQLDPGSPYGTVVARVAKIAPGQSAQLDTSRFVKADGTGFVPADGRQLSFTLRVQTPQGVASWSGKPAQ